MSEFKGATPFDISGQVVAITGGGGTLGSAMAGGLARAGARIAVLGHRIASAERVAQAIVADGGEAAPFQVDVLERDSLLRCADEVIARFGRVDGLINAAGGSHPAASTTPDRSFFDLSREALQSVFDLNMMGTLMPCQVFGQLMAQRGEGAIINIASMSSIRPLTKVPAYSASKAAVKNFTEWLAVHMSQNYSTRIRVNAIAPGFFLTNLNRYLLLSEGTEEMTPRGKSIIDHTPMARYGEPDDLIGTAIWLLSPGASFVHGITVPVDGGFSAFGGV